MISVLIIAKNDEEVIKDCITSVKDLADEIIVVDGGSDDKTVETAEKAGAKTVWHPFRNFSDQRNFASSLAHEPWILYLDADERANESFISEVKLKVMENNDKGEMGGFRIRRRTFFYGKDWHFEDGVERLFKKDHLKGWKGIVHETPEVEGRLLDIDAPVEHYTHRSFEQMIDKTNEWSEYEADLRLKSHHPKMTAWRFPRVMLTGFLSSYFGQGGWKNGTAGIIEAIYQAFSMFITYAKVWEKQAKRD